MEWLASGALLIGMVLVIHALVRIIETAMGDEDAGSHDGGDVSGRDSEGGDGGIGRIA